MIRKSVFSYLITEEKITIPELPIEKEFGKYTIFIDENTPFDCACSNSVICAIYGLAVNVVTGKRDGLAEEIANCCKSIFDLLAYEKNLGGKYILLFKSNEQHYLLGDATCSIPTFYSTEGAAQICSNNCYYIANAKKYPADPEFTLIRKSGEISQAMPNDITTYRQIKQLIPNHFLELGKSKATRFVNSAKKQKAISIEEATEITLPMIENLLRFYQIAYKIYCPITSGRDSRVVLSLLAKSGKPYSCYTIKHPEHNEATQDLLIPPELCNKANTPHRFIEDVIVPDSLKNEFDTLFGSGNYSLRTLRIAETIRSSFGDGAILNGDIIGQIGKCSLHRDIPSLFASPFYFRCKLHNYSSGAKSQLRAWMDEIRSVGENINLFDLFSIENRMGRWAGQENSIYNVLGLVYLNVFNCRKIIYTWTAVKRRERKKSKLHVALIESTCPSLLDVAYEKDESIIFRISKATGITYLLSSYAKYYIEKAKFEKRTKL